MYYNLISNVLIVLFLCCFVIWIDLSLNKKYSRYILGVVFGLITIFVMQGHIMVVEDRFYDFRHITMMMAGFIGGPVSAVIAALISSLYRYNMGGSGSMGGILTIITFACLGSIMAGRLKSRQNGKKVWFWFINGIFMSFVLIFIIAFTPWKSDSVKILRAVAVPFLIITPLATTIIFNFYFLTREFISKATILDAIINCSPVNLVIFDDNGPILFSKTLEMNLPSYHFIEKPELLLDLDKPLLDSIKQQHRDIDTEDGRHFVTEMSSFQMPNGQYACLAIINDVTDRKREQETLLKVKKKLLEAQEFAHLGYWELNTISGEYPWSDELFRIYGFKPQEFVPTLNDFINMIHPDDKDSLMKVIKEPLSLNERELDFRVIRQDHTTIWIHEKIKYEFNASGKEVRRYGVVLDITQRKLSELKLKESEEKFREVAENLGEVIWVRQEGNFVYISPAYDKVWGRTSQSLYDNPDSFIDSIHPDDKEKIIRTYVNQNDISNGLFDEQYRIIRPDGKIRWIWSREYPIYDQSGSMIRLLGICDDITKIKEFEVSLKQSTEKAEAANIAKTQFLANMSHEIRTPMNGVMGMLQLLKMTELTKQQSNYLRVSMTSSESLLKVINDILDYSTIEAGKLNIESIKFNLAEFLNEIEIMFKPSVWKKGFAFKILIEENVPHRLIGDSFRLRQVLSNLIGNAIKFTQKGGIDVIVRKLEDRNNEVTLGWVVQDTGIGLSQDRLKTIFNSFSQADSSTTRQYGGTGLGLTICKGLVQNMKGEIWAESKEGKGSSFYFTCVLEKSEEDDNNKVTADVNIGDSANDDVLKLLIVEDDGASRMVIEQLARKKGWEVISVENGKEAIDAYRRQRFDVVLMDVQTPVLDGYKATGVIRQIEKQNDIHTHTPIIAMTAHALKGDREKCLESGMDGYLSKPIDADKFYATVEKWTKNI